MENTRICMSFHKSYVSFTRNVAERFLFCKEIWFWMILILDDFEMPARGFFFWQELACRVFWGPVAGIQAADLWT